MLRCEAIPYAGRDKVTRLLNYTICVCVYVWCDMGDMRDMRDMRDMSVMEEMGGWCRGGGGFLIHPRKYINIYVYIYI